MDDYHFNNIVIYIIICINKNMEFLQKMDIFYVFKKYEKLINALLNSH
jgi:hypothetical protein